MAGSADLDADAPRGRRPLLCRPARSSPMPAGSSRAADDLEGVIDAAVGEPRTAAAGSSVARRRPRGRPARQCELELRRIAIDRDDRAAPASTRPATTCSPTPPQPITQTALADAGRARRCARPRRRSPRRSRAARPATAAPRPAAARRRAAGTTRPLGEARDREAVLQRRPVRQAQARSSRPSASRARRRSPAGPQRFGRPARQARACAARRHDAEHDAIARRDVRDPLADGLDAPAPSCPSTIGQRPSPRRPSARWRSEWQTPRPRCARAPRPPSAGPARPPRRGRRPARAPTTARPHATRQRSSASRSGVTPSPGPGGGAIVPSAAISTRRRQQPVAPLGRPGRRVVRHLDERARRDARARGAGCRRARSRSTTCAG